MRIIYELPVDALREALVMLWSTEIYSMRGTSIYVEIYDDRVEVVNPGGPHRRVRQEKFEGTSNPPE